MWAQLSTVNPAHLQLTAKAVHGLFGTEDTRPRLHCCGDFFGVVSQGNVPFTEITALQIGSFRNTSLSSLLVHFSLRCSTPPTAHFPKGT